MLLAELVDFYGDLKTFFLDQDWSPPIGTITEAEGLRLYRL